MTKETIRRMETTDPMSNAGTESTRGPQIVNQSTDRTMKYYSVAEIELRGLRNSSTFMTVCFSIATSAVGLGIDSYKEYHLTGNEGALPWAIALVIIAVPFLAFGIYSAKHRRGIEGDIRSGSSGKE